MASSCARSIVAYAILSLAGAGPSWLAALTAAGDPPDDPPEKVWLSCTVRDFDDAHVDFETMPSNGPGVYAGLVETRLGPSYLPVFQSNGHRVMTHAADASGRRIAPHLAAGGLVDPDGSFRVLLVVQNAVTLTVQDAAKKTMFESWGHPVSVIADEATQAQFDAACLVHDVAYVSEEVDHGTLGLKMRNAPIGIVNEDKDLSDSEFGFSASKRTYTDTRITITDNTHYITQGLPLGAVTVTTDTWNFSRADGGLAPGAVRLADKYGQAEPVLMAIERDAERHAIGPAPARRVRTPWGNHSVNFLTMNATGLQITRRCIGWAAANNPGQCNGSAPGDTLASLDSVASNGGIVSAGSFAEWFTDIPGVNISGADLLCLVRQVDGTYLFDDTLDLVYSMRGGFYPIDGMHFGNTPSAPEHNHHFTYHCRATFTYDQAADQFVFMETDSDAWVFVHDRLAIDLGGIHGLIEQRVDLNRLCLVDGQEYDLHFFLADRSQSTSRLRVHTNILFEGTMMPTVTSAFD